MLCFGRHGDPVPALLTDLKSKGLLDSTLVFCTSEFGRQPTHSYDLHATALHLLGLDHEKLTVYHDGIMRRLTDVHGRVIKAIVT